MKELKIAIIGGGSSYTPEIIEGFIKRQDELPVKEIYLVDIPEGLEKLEIVGALAQRMVKKAGLNIEVILTTDRRAAIKDADFVTTQFRVGGLKARARDERFPLKYNVLGQETTGPGGFAKALRTIPVILDICKDIEELAPNAWLINFTNPAGLITEVVQKYTKVKVIGLCNVPIGMVKMIGDILEVDSRRIKVDFVGLNHLVWGKKVYLDGKDITQEIINKLSDGASLTMKNIPDLKWDREFLDSLGMLPCPYHRYYYMTDEILKEEKESIKEGGPGTRAEQVQKVEGDLFKLYKNENLDEKPKELEKRGGAYYSEAAVSLISAIYNDKRELHVVNIKNNGTIKGLPEDVVIEVTCVVDKTGAHPIQIGELPPKIYGLINAVKAYEELAAEAGVKGDSNLALQALAVHPLVPSVGVAKKLLEEILADNKNYLPQFNKKEKKIIFNGDDFGFTSGCNKGIIEAMKNGVITSTTLTVNMSKAEEAIALAKENGITSIGIHLTLTCGRPVLDPKEVPSLVDENGNFYRRATMLRPVIKLEEAEREFRAQINKFLQMGVKLDHMDTHHHIHIYDGIREIVANLAKEYNLPLRGGNEECKRLYNKMGIKTTDHFTWDFYGEKVTLENLKSIIENLGEGTIEIMCHPAFVDDELKQISLYVEKREEELNILKSKELKEWLASKNIELITFQDLGD